MGTFHIEQRKLTGVADVTARALYNQGFNSLEIMLGLGEFIGKLVVMEGSTPVQMMELLTVINERMVSSTRMGAEAKGFSRASSEDLH